MNTVNKRSHIGLTAAGTTVAGITGSDDLERWSLTEGLLFLCMMMMVVSREKLLLKQKVVLVVATSCRYCFIIQTPQVTAAQNATVFFIVVTTRLFKTRGKKNKIFFKSALYFVRDLNLFVQFL